MRKAKKEPKGSFRIKQMKYRITANKPGLYIKFLVRLAELQNFYKGSAKNIISFPEIFEKVCRGFSIKKSEAWDYLRMFHELGFITIIPYHGIKINYEVSYDE